ncbi:MAG TPA: acetamidase/formamidase family protein [Armatimonadota bacterium]|nr:acetamidase/formamidase family protein [Armatimonadota bacterium]
MPTTHRIEPDIANLHGKISRDLKPILTIEPGDSISAKTLCYRWGFAPPLTPGTLPQIIPLDERKDPENDGDMALDGPIFVKGAKPGMTLEVSIDELQVGSYGVVSTDTSERNRRLGIEDGFAVTSWEFDRSRGIAISNTGFSVKLNPFLGWLGVAPAEPGYHSNHSGRRIGGNLDCKELVAGAKLYLPIEVEGALFSFGDGHAAQGDGEICDTAIECPMDVCRLTLNLRDDMPLEWPIARLPGAWMTLGFHEDLTEAMFIATNGMLDLMVQKLGVSRKDAYMLASQVVDLRITQIVNPTYGVHAVWADDTLVLNGK